MVTTYSLEYMRGKTYIHQKVIATAYLLRQSNIVAMDFEF